MSDVQWKPFDYENKKATAPPAGELVWIVEEYYFEGVTVGYFDGYTMRTWTGSDDCSVTYWAPIEFPVPPPEAEEDAVFDGDLEFDPDKLEAAIQRGMDNPMPPALRESVADEIERETLNTDLKHRAVMGCIDIAYPLILDYLRGHPEALGGNE